MKLLIILLLLLSVCFGWIQLVEKLHQEHSIKIYRNGAFKNDPHFTLLLSSLASSKDGNEKLKEMFRRACIKLNVFERKMDLRLFEEDSTEITKYEDLRSGHNYFMTVERGEPFVYPSWTVGDEIRLKHMKDIDGNTLKLKIISQKPRIFLIEKLFSDTDIDNLMKVKDCANWENSTQFDKQGKLYTDTSRTSASGWLETNCGPIVHHFNTRIEQINKIYGLSESLQLLKYGTNQHYYRHFDAHPPERYDTRNRFITFLLYLNNVEEGGCTAFPHATRLEDNTVPSETIDNTDCERGIKFCPIKGSALMFYDLKIPEHMAGIIDPHSSHIGCDVIKGIKYAANKWIWNKPNNWRQNSIYV